MHIPRPHTNATFQSFQVIFGRGKACSNSPGNKKLQAIVKSFASSYESAATKEQKSCIVSTVASLIKKDGAFIKHEECTWWQVDETYAREKIGYLFRYHLQSLKKRDAIKPKINQVQRKFDFAAMRQRRSLPQHLQSESMLNTTRFSPSQSVLFCSPTQPVTRQVTESSSSLALDAGRDHSTPCNDQRKAYIVDTCARALNIVESAIQDIMTPSELSMQPTPLHSSFPPASISVPNEISMEITNGSDWDMLEPIEYHDRFIGKGTEDDPDTGSLATIDGENFLTVFDDDADDYSGIFD